VSQHSLLQPLKFVSVEFLHDVEDLVGFEDLHGPTHHTRARRNELRHVLTAVGDDKAEKVQR
jgi:hypothetical protein